MDPQRTHDLPLLRVPRLMEESLDQDNLGGFLLHPYLLWGLSIPICLHLLGGLHYYYPSVPQLPTLLLAGPYFPKHGLLAGFHKLKIYIYPAFIGFAFLTARQISLSFWLFFLLGALLVGLLSVLGYNIPAASLGVTFGPTLARPEETQMIGAYGVFFLFLLWLSRYHLRDVLRQAFRPGPVVVETEWFSVRLAFWIGVAAMAGIVLWAVFFGMRLQTATLLVAVFFMITLVASRIICQGGLAYFTLTAAPWTACSSFSAPACLARWACWWPPWPRRCCSLTCANRSCPLCSMPARCITPCATGGCCWPVSAPPCWWR
ncbi:hypothetical protein GF1_01830 [Desulfolithobacter dissulfuricans]|uniref:DUF6785 domain-containing protein n=1 Tax=Desulfolithobacter dissulfuricans TaxID=2795293 RepID=A0A915U4K3_9BACT|nr:hypothetical protein GF1_01830 [Desulfolithobacter dissulfuricans]